MRSFLFALALVGCGGGGAAAPPPEAPVSHAAPAPPPDEIPSGRGGERGTEELPRIEMPPPMPPGGDCDAVADRLQPIMEQMVEQQLDEELAGEPPEVQAEAQRYARAALPNMRLEIAQLCVDQAWSAELRDCVLVAPTMEALEACDALIPGATP
jgi:hypothetical protein